MEATWLQTTWFFLYFVLIAGYAVLDGFDLGVGVLSLFERDPDRRRLYLNAIAPVWDGNEVWLLTGGGALFAAFPHVYATVFSGFYLALMLVLLALIARAVAIEFRGKVASAGWRRVWDASFGVGSLLAAVLFGVAVGNVVRGIPIGADREFAGSFIGLLNPFSLLVGLLTLAMFLVQGAHWMAWKTTGELRNRMGAIAARAWVAWVLLYAAATVYGFFEAPHLFRGTLSKPLFWVLFLALMGGLVAQPLAWKAKRFGQAFLGSSSSIVALIGLGAVGLYPTLVPSSIDPAFSLTAMNASSSEKTLTVMLVIALIGMPLVLSYTAWIYRHFRGPVVLDEHSY